MYSKADFTTDAKTDANMNDNMNDNMNAKTDPEPPRPSWCTEKTSVLLLLSTFSCSKDDTPSDYQKCLDYNEKWRKSCSECLEWLFWKKNN